MEQNSFLAIQNLLASGSIFGVAGGALMLPECTLLVEDFATRCHTERSEQPGHAFQEPWY